MSNVNVYHKHLVIYITYWTHVHFLVGRRQVHDVYGAPSYIYSQGRGLSTTSKQAYFLDHATYIVLILWKATLQCTTKQGLMYWRRPTLKMRWLIVAR